MILEVLIALNLVLGLAVLAIVIRSFRKKEGGDAFLEPLKELSARVDSFERYLRDDVQRLRSDLLEIGSQIRMEMSASISLLSNNLKTENKTNREEQSKSLSDLSESLSRKMQELTSTQQTQSDALKDSLENRMEQIRANNETKLEEMRKTVDEKLHDTLEKRLGESFNQVSERLELVHQGLGEMQSLARGVGDLKKVLTNVKTRGVMGEMQLDNLLEQLLVPEQYERNFKPNPRRDEHVEFAIRLPGRDEDLKSVYLPIDAKFPIEDYHRLIDAYDNSDLAGIEAARKSMVTRIKGCARDIRDKYLNPPLTTDFALLFLPVEGLYAEVLRNSGLFETVQREFHVIIVGPTTIAAILNSLQIGFRTLAIEKRSSEVWKLLSAIKSEFAKFGVVLEKTQKKIQEAGNVLETAHHRSKQIERKLNRVQEIPVIEATQILDLEELALEADEDVDE
ncbi:MAG: DNA recombination protein RmuC [Candidatus Cloacimonadaceae bacterium]|nr:DNA recombination protein RmuC [Candidatus Cloacimonadaceae bacterium]MDP3114476.1 DNA recombination protein RmuC [Candidatus Cloacimonadaceae bacterium]